MPSSTVTSIPLTELAPSVKPNASRKNRLIWQFFPDTGKTMVKCVYCGLECNRRIKKLEQHLKEKHNEGPNDIYSIYQKKMGLNTSTLTPIPGCILLDNETVHMISAQPLQIPIKDGNYIQVQGHSKKDQTDSNYAKIQNELWPKLYFIAEKNVKIYVPPNKTVNMKMWGIEDGMIWVEWVLSSTPGSEPTIELIREMKLRGTDLAAHLLKSRRQTKIPKMVPNAHFNLLQLHTKLVCNIRKVQDFIKQANTIMN